MTEIPGGALKLAKAADRAGLRVRIDHRPRSCLVRIQDDAEGLGAVAVYYPTPKGWKAQVAYRWTLEERNMLTYDRFGVAALARWLVLKRRLAAAQAEMVQP